MDEFFSRQDREARGPDPRRPASRKPRRRKLARRVALASVTALAVLGGVVVAGGYVAVNHLASSVNRIHGIAALTAADQPVMPAATRRSMTVLLTGSATRPSRTRGSGADGSSTSPELQSGLIALVHLNADKRGGAVVSIPANTVVRIPGHGRMQLWDTLTTGGPSLLIRTVERLTKVRIEHYSVLDFAGTRNVVGAMNGVSVDVPHRFTSFGFVFRAGINHLTAARVLPYVRQVRVSEVTRTEVQQNLIRAILDKIARKRMFSQPATDYRVLRAVAAALSVDSDMSNSELESLALSLGHLQGPDGTFITAPTRPGGSPTTGPVFLNQPITRKLWSAIRHDSVAAFARRYPFTVTPGAPG